MAFAASTAAAAHLVAGAAASAAAAALVLAAALAPGAEAITQELYTTNAVCKQRYCVNPVFPAIEQIPQLESRRWEKHNLDNVSSWMEFCGGIVDYDPAIPMANSSQRLQLVLEDMREGQPVIDSDVLAHGGSIQDMVMSLDRQAAKSYFYHLSGMGIEAWDHTEPMQVSHHPLRPCARSVARLACSTYFPMAYTSLLEGQEVRYLRPCKSSCENYLQACNVECCDESVTCVWDGLGSGSGPENAAKTTQDGSGKTVLLQTGYVDAVGPSLHCTGGAMSGAAALPGTPWTAAAAAAAMLWFTHGAAA